MNDVKDRWISHQKTLKITRLIDQQIVLRTQQLHHLVELKRSIIARNVRGQLMQSDLMFIKRKLKEMK